MPRGSAAYYADKPKQYAKLKAQATATTHAKRRKAYALVNAYKARKGCADCGERDSAVLDLDHDDPRQKRDSVSRLINRNHAAASLFTEIKKCTVRCANCHRRRTAKQQGWYVEQATLAELADAQSLDLCSSE